MGTESSNLSVSAKKFRVSELFSGRSVLEDIVLCSVPNMMASACGCA